MTRTEEIGGFPRPVLRSVVDDVPVYSSADEGPVTATLLFRVGRIDERLTTSGITHLVEHLAMPPPVGHGFELNANVGSLVTSFWAHGEQAEVTAFLSGVCSALRPLPLERFDVERRILESESAGGVSPYKVLTGARFGARGVGLVRWFEPGLKRITPEEAAAWARTRFTLPNAVCWTTGDPEALVFELPDGNPEPAPPLVQAPFQAPAFVQWGSGRMAFSAVAPRGSAAPPAGSLLRDRIMHELRFEHGISYSVDVEYEALSAAIAHMVLVADVLAGQEAQVLERMLRTIETFARDGPRQEELEQYRERARRAYSDPDGVRGWLETLARSNLLGWSCDSYETVLEKVEALTPDDVAAAGAELLSDVLFCVPDGFDPRPRLRLMPGPDVPPVEGRRFSPPFARLRRPDRSVVVGPDGVSFRRRDETTTIRADDAVGLFRAEDSRVIVNGDADIIALGGSDWRSGRALLEAIDATYPRELWIDD